MIKITDTFNCHCENCGMVTRHLRALNTEHNVQTGCTFCRTVTVASRHRFPSSYHRTLAVRLYLFD